MSSSSDRSRWPQGPQWLLFIIPLVAFGVLFRFVALETSPPGFYVDEAAISAQVICLRQSGADLHGQRWPLFSQVLGGGYATPAYLYTGALWTALFGDSITSFRSMVALFGALTVVGVFFLALRLWRNPEVAWLSALCAALSPWGFQFSRIAWDPPLAPCFFILSLVLLLAAASKRRWINAMTGIIGGAFASLAMYSYPPLRVQVVLVLPVFLYLAIRRERQSLSRIPWFIGAFIVVLIPLTKLTWTGEIQGRFNALSIFNEAYLRDHGGSSPLNVMRLFFENIGLNLSPRYLFLSGDANLRHSTQAVGEWSWLEILALASSIPLLLYRRYWETKADLRITLILAWAYLAAVLPASLTWESNPHALRSIGAYPFLALLAGWTLYRFTRWGRVAKALVSFVATTFCIWFGLDFYTEYPARADLWFDQPAVLRLSDVVQQGHADEISSAVRSVYPEYPDLAISYYELRFKTKTCATQPGLKNK